MHQSRILRGHLPLKYIRKKKKVRHDVEKVVDIKKESKIDAWDSDVYHLIANQSTAMYICPQKPTETV